MENNQTKQSSFILPGDQVLQSQGKLTALVCQWAVSHPKAHLHVSPEDAAESKGSKISDPFPYDLVEHILVFS